MNKELTKDKPYGFTVLKTDEEAKPVLEKMIRESHACRAKLQESLDDINRALKKKQN